MATVRLHRFSKASTSDRRLASVVGNFDVPRRSLAAVSTSSGERRRGVACVFDFSSFGIPLDSLTLVAEFSGGA